MSLIHFRTLHPPWTTSLDRHSKMKLVGHSIASICKKTCSPSHRKVWYPLLHSAHILHLQYCYKSSSSLLMPTCNPPYLSQALERGIHQQACGGGVAMATDNTELNRSINTRQHPPGQERYHNSPIRSPSQLLQPTQMKFSKQGNFYRLS